MAQANMIPPSWSSAFPGLVFFRVLGGTGRVNDGGVHDRSALHNMPAGCHYPVDRVKKLSVQLVFFQQMPEIT